MQRNRLQSQYLEHNGPTYDGFSSSFHQASHSAIRKQRGFSDKSPCFDERIDRRQDYIVTPDSTENVTKQIVRKCSASDGSSPSNCFVSSSGIPHQSSENGHDENLLKDEKRLRKQKKLEQRKKILRQEINRLLNAGIELDKNDEEFFSKFRRVKITEIAGVRFVETVQK